MVNFKAMTNLREFGKEWQDNKKITVIFSAMSFFGFISLLWIMTNVPEFSSEANIYALMIIFGSVIALIDFVSEKNILSGFVYFGKSINVALTAIIAGTVLGVLMQIGNFAVIQTPLAITQSTTLGAFFFVVLIAPYVEEKFFRMAAYPTVVNLLNVITSREISTLISIALVSLVFALFHYLVFSASVELFIAAFAFSVIAIIGNRFFESTGFGVAMHYVNNFIAFGGVPAMMLALGLI